jgi:hypothetical protein
MIPLRKVIFCASECINICHQTSHGQHHLLVSRRKGDRANSRPCSVTLSPRPWGSPPFVIRLHRVLLPCYVKRFLQIYAAKQVMLGFSQEKHLFIIIIDTALGNHTIHGKIKLFRSGIRHYLYIKCNGYFGGIIS